MIATNSKNNSKNKVILLVEDDQEIREAFQTILEEEGYSIYSAENGKMALEMLPSLPRPNLILLDMMMPIMDGWKFSNLLRDTSLFSDIPRVAMTAVQNNLASVSVRATLKKPIDIHDLIMTVERFCGDDKKSPEIDASFDLQQQLEVNASILEATLDSIKDGILIIDQSGKIILHNKRFLELWKIPVSLQESKSDDALLGFVLSQLLNPEAFIEKVRLLYEQPHAESSDELHFKDGRVFERYSRPRYLAGRCFGRVWSFHDITQQRRAENELKIILENEKSLRESAQLSLDLKDEFIAIASHELRTPLTPLSLQLQMFKRFFEEPEVAAMPKVKLYEKMVASAGTQVDRLDRLVDDLLSASRITCGALTLKPERMDLTALISEIVECYSSKLKEAQCTICLDFTEKVDGQWDRIRLEQVFTNLVCNAIKFGNGKPITITVRSNSQYVSISVRDQGIGIKKEDQVRIFERFERTVAARQFDGLGLGLYIVKQILEGHHGSITVESILGKGSNFTVKLPLMTVI